MPPDGQEDCAALRQCLREAITTLECNVMHALLGGFATRVGLKQVNKRVKYLYKTVDCHMEHEKFFSGNEEDKATVPWEVSEQERHITGLDGKISPAAAVVLGTAREHRPSSAHGNVVFLGELFEWQTARCSLHVERCVFSPLVVFTV